LDKTQDHEESKSELDLSRRQFLGGVGGVTATLAGGLTGVAALSGLTGEEGVAEAIEIGPLTPSERADASKAKRKAAADAEKALGLPDNTCNGDEDLYPSRIGNYHKCLPHDSVTGLVDQAAYNSLLGAIQMGTFAAFEAVPLAGGRLLNPLGANAFSLEGPDAHAVSTPAPPPTLASAELAADAAELYWMQLCRDISFTDYATSPLIADACADLNNLPGYQGPVDPSTNTVTPQVLFRMNAPGVLDGPMVSQFLLRNWVFDASQIPARVLTALPGEDYMTEWNEWLNQQNGLGGGANPNLDGVTRVPRNVRDIGMVSAFDRVYTMYLRAAHIMQNFGAFNNGTGGMDVAHPYRTSTKQAGFVTFGLAWIFETLAAIGLTEKNCWWTKWNVHRFIRPEAYGGLVHKAVADGMDLPIHSDLTDVSTVLPRVFAANQARNIARFGAGSAGTYLLSQGLRTGCPNHPSYTAGHAFTAGACVTFMKAIFNESTLWQAPIVPQKPTADGTATVPYVVGVDGPALTIGGELNKLAHNLSIGRNMIGIHWRADDSAGLAQGEAVAIRFLREQKACYPEPFTGFTLTKFDGTTITIA
jgi:hypothetical protein